MIYLCDSKQALTNFGQRECPLEQLFVNFRQSGMTQTFGGKIKNLHYSPDVVS